MSRNQFRLLNEEQIENIKAQVAYDLVRYSQESANTLVNHYLEGNTEELFNTITEWIESAEGEVLNEINTQLDEDSFKSNKHKDEDI
jgi:transcriptional regulator with AAA-type ATPase domain